MQVKDMLQIMNVDFFSGVPDSQLKALCNYLMDTYGIDSKHHIIAVNEGSSVGLAAGYYLSTGKIPAVYMQNSGEGNAVNPVVSLLNDNVYAIPMIFIIGWRGEPGSYDEPQHIYQGKITLSLLKVIGIEYFVVDKNTSINEINGIMKNFNVLLLKGKQVAFVIKKGALEYSNTVEYKNQFSLSRENVIEQIVSIANEDLIISTTGKASRELFEVRERKKQDHKHDFLTVGSMGHSSSIALGVALNVIDRKIWCIDGDGAVLMHMGAMATIGAIHPHNFVHIIINNSCHETVGGMPTVAKQIDFPEIAKGCGYVNVTRVENFKDLGIQLEKAKYAKELTLIEVCCNIGSRLSLGRPTTSAIENKINFMDFLNLE